MTWPQSVDWREIEFGVEIEWVGAPQGAIELLPGWEIVAEDSLFFDDGRMVDPVRGDDVMGGELTSPRLTWDGRDEIAVMCSRLKAVGAVSNWSCGLHVHADGSRWGSSLLLPGLDAALATEQALQQLVDTAPHRLDYAPRTTVALREAVAEVVRAAQPVARSGAIGRSAPQRAVDAGAILRRLVYGRRPPSHRGGINFRPLFDTGSVEFRLPNASLEPDEIYRTVELWLRWMAATGEGRRLPGSPPELAREVGAPSAGYPPRQEAPAWWWRRRAVDRALYPVLLPHCQAWFRELFPHVEEECDIVWIDGTAEAHVVVLSESGDKRAFLVFGSHHGDWKRIEASTEWRPGIAGRSQPGARP